MGPRDITNLDVDAARRAGVVAVDLGRLDASSAPAAMGSALSAKGAGWVATAEFALGGGDADTESRTLLDLEESGLAVQARLVVAPRDQPGDDLGASLARLRARDPRRTALLDLAREVDARAERAAALVRPRRPSARRLLRRLLRG